MLNTALSLTALSTPYSAEEISCASSININENLGDRLKPSFVRIRQSANGSHLTIGLAETPYLVFAFLIISLSKNRRISSVPSHLPIATR